MYSPNMSFKGWELGKFLKGRKKLLIAAIGYIASYLATRNPALSGIIAAGAELGYAVIEYYVKRID